jgi:broad specificity phosphatase PhoE
MKKIIFLRPAPYSDLISGKDLISSFDLNGLQLNDPILDSEINDDVYKKINKLKDEFNIVNVVSSPASRCLQTAKMFGLPIVVNDKLREIKFSVKDLVLEEKSDLDIDLLRKDLVISITKNKAPEKMDEILKRIDSCLKEVMAMSGDTVCISHAFVMKFFEIFIENKERVSSYEIFSEKYNWKEKPYEFLEGFCIHFDGNLNLIEIESI